MRKLILILSIATLFGCSKKPVHAVQITYACYSTAATYPFQFTYYRGKNKQVFTVNKGGQYYVQETINIKEGEKFDIGVDGIAGYTVSVVISENGIWSQNKVSKTSVELEGVFFE